MATTQHDHEPDDVGGTVVEVPIRPEAVVAARTAVERAARRAGLGRDRVDDLLVATSEACTNALEANQRVGCGDPIVVTCVATADGRALEVAVVDCGGGFDPAAVAARPPHTDPAHLDIERGWGIQLMRELVDELTFEPTGAGTTVRLRMRLDRG